MQEVFIKNYNKFISEQYKKDMVPIIFKKTSKTELLPLSSVADPDPNPVHRIHMFLGLLDPSITKQKK
jgi:hypothetical protein